MAVAISASNAADEPRTKAYAFVSRARTARSLDSPVMHHVHHPFCNER
jgi:hypothetical protein